MLLTALGRLVDVNNWKAHHRDAILKLLWDLRQLGGAREEGALTALGRVTGLEPEEIVALCDALIRSGLLVHGGKGYRLTTVGALAVRQQLARRARGIRGR